MTATLFVLAVALAAGCLGGILGAGSSILLLPVLVHAAGPKQAVPIMAVASVLGNAARVAAWCRSVDWRAAAAYALPGAPAAALGARTLVALPPRWVEIALGVFFLAMVLWRRRRAGTPRRIGLPGLALAGAGVGFVTGVVLSTGPLSVPVFLAYGLSGGAFIATEAASALLLALAKVGTFRKLGALPAELLVQGLVVGGALMAGTWLGKLVLLRTRPEAIRLLLDAVMTGAGLWLLWGSVR